MTFEDYLEKIYVQGDGRMILDDYLEDAFNAWLEKLDNLEIIEYANQWRKLETLKENYERILSSHTD